MPEFFTNVPNALYDLPPWATLLVVLWLYPIGHLIGKAVFKCVGRWQNHKTKQPQRR